MSNENEQQKKKRTRDSPDAFDMNEEMIQVEEDRMRVEEAKMHADEDRMHADEAQMRLDEARMNIEEFEHDVETKLGAGSSPRKSPIFHSSNHPRKSISIRGVNAEIYDQFVNQIKKIDLNVGDAITKLMKDVINTFDEEFPELSANSLKMMSLERLNIVHHDGITITKQDLVESGRKVSFINCRDLTFAKDIDKPTFLQYVEHITNCDGITMPKILPKLISYSKLQRCRNIKFYEVESANDAH